MYTNLISYKKGKKNYKKNLPHNHQVGATRRVLLTAKINIPVAIQNNTNFSGRFNQINRS